MSAKDVDRSENILKNQSLVKEGFEIDNSLKDNSAGSEDINRLLQQVEMKISSNLMRVLGMYRTTLLATSHIKLLSSTVIAAEKHLLHPVKKIAPVIHLFCLMVDL